MVWYSHLFQNFPQFIVIHTVKVFGLVNKAWPLIPSFTVIPVLPVLCLASFPEDNFESSPLCFFYHKLFLFIAEQSERVNS